MTMHPSQVASFDPGDRMISVFFLERAKTPLRCILTVHRTAAVVTTPRNGTLPATAEVLAEGQQGPSINTKKKNEKKHHKARRIHIYRFGINEPNPAPVELVNAVPPLLPLLLPLLQIRHTGQLQGAPFSVRTEPARGTYVERG